MRTPRFLPFSYSSSIDIVVDKWRSRASGGTTGFATLGPGHKFTKKVPFTHCITRPVEELIIYGQNSG
jgi:hypothetical protein